MWGWLGFSKKKYPTNLTDEELFAKGRKLFNQLILNEKNVRKAVYDDIQEVNGLPVEMRHKVLSWTYETPTAAATKTFEEAATEEEASSAVEAAATKDDAHEPSTVVSATLQHLQH
jgi:hypothetical protein